MNKREPMWIGLVLIAVVSYAARAEDNTLSTAQIRTLKNAVTVVQVQPQIKQLVEDCPADVVQYLPAAVESADEASTDLLLTQKLHITRTELINLLHSNEKFAALTQATVVRMPACEDRETILDLTEQFSHHYTALELSDAIPKWQDHFFPKADGPVMDPAQLTDLIQNSHSIVLVKIQPKSILTALQQANYLHIDDKSAYVFEVQQGWKSVAGRYHGLHVHLAADNPQQQRQSWLLFLDPRFHPKTALQGAQLRQALQALGRADWTFNRQGDLLRAE